MAEGEEINWELLGRFAKRGPEIDRDLLRSVLAGSLTRRGHTAIVVEDARAFALQADERLGKLFGAAVLWGLGVASFAYIGIPLILCPLGFFASVALILLAMSIANKSSFVPSLVTLAWLIVGVLELVQGTDFKVFALAYLAPGFLLTTYALATRALRLRQAQDVALAVGGVVQAAPLIAPVVLLFLFLPALSADVWQVANGLDLNSYLFAGVLSVGLLVVVVGLQLRSQIESVLIQRSAQLSEEPNRAELTRNQVSGALPEDEAAILEGIEDEGIDASWPNAGEEYAPYLSAAEGSTLQAPLSARFLLTVIVVGLLLSLYIYLLCSAVVMADTAKDWTGATAPAIEIAGITFHGGVYLRLSGLLGIAATATFLSFALIEDRFANALTNALLRDPADRFLALALPYVHLRAILLGDGISTTEPDSSDH
ncbi:MAG TPA: hypothetical protein VKA53_05760 [Thermoanaerobaculia bacterium]|jgi:hypothetical protein|nr:hypothetical protein [Thermoanaerobaculia bacterium]